MTKHIPRTTGAIPPVLHTSPMIRQPRLPCVLIVPTGRCQAASIAVAAGVTNGPLPHPRASARQWINVSFPSLMGHSPQASFPLPKLLQLSPAPPHPRTLRADPRPRTAPSTGLQAAVCMPIVSLRRLRAITATNTGLSVCVRNAIACAPVNPDGVPITSLHRQWPRRNPNRQRPLHHPKRHPRPLQQPHPRDRLSFAPGHQVSQSFLTALASPALPVVRRVGLSTTRAATS